MKLYVFLKDGFEEVEAVTIVDYLRRAGIVVELVSFEKEKLVKGAHKIDITADIMAENVEITDDTAIFIPRWYDANDVTFKRPKGIRIY